MRALRPVVILAAISLVACSDNANSPLDPSTSAAADVRQGFEGLGVFQRYVAIGTSISMGVSSDGVYAASQQMSFPAQLSRLANREMSLPLISFPGCASPLKINLISFQRLSGEGAGVPFLSRQCAANEQGVELPTQNVAIDGARTGQALTANPDPGHATQYPRVLAPGMSQITAMEAQSPKIVSVELGGNDILGASHGIYYPGVSVVPVFVWEPQYREIAARVDAAAKHAVLVGLVNDVASFPSFRTGAEIWNARASFAQLGVVVAGDCENSTNLIFVAIRVPAAVASAAQGGSNIFSCFNYPSSSFVEDYVLDATDVAAVNQQLAQMNAVIQDEATKRGFAYFPLGALYEGVVTKPTFNAYTLMTSTQPYGPYVSLDGVHPTAEGSRVLADAAAQALNDTYHLGIPLSGGASLALLSGK